MTDFIIDRKLDEQAAKQREAERLAEEKRLQREREVEQRRSEEKEREKENEISRRRQEKPISTTGGYVPPNKRPTADSTSWRRSTSTTESQTTNREESGVWRRTGSGRDNVPEDGTRRRESARSSTDEGPEWRRSDSGRGSTTEDKVWRRSDSGRGTSTEENRRRTSVTSYREESSVKQESSWRRGGQQPSDRGDRSDSKWKKGREDSWRKDTEDLDSTSPSSSRGPTRILKSENSWRSRKQSESSVMERTSSGREIWTATLQEKFGDEQDEYNDEPEEDQTISPGNDEQWVRSEDNSKTQAPISSEKQSDTIEPDSDGFIQVTKGKRRGKNQSGHGYDLE